MILTLRCGHQQESTAKAGSTLTCRTCKQRCKITQAIFAAGRPGGTSQAIDHPPSAQTQIGTASANFEPGPTPVTEADNGMRLADVDDATAPLGEQLGALIRLLLSAACARHHLRGKRTSGWLGGVAAGPTQTGKTLAGFVVAAALGLDQLDAVKLTSAESEKSLWGRREQQDKETWVIRAAPVLTRPFVVVDELDKASAPVRKATLRLLQGQTKVPGEPGQTIEIACTPLVTCNTRPEVVPPEYRRRSVVLDMTGAPMIDTDVAAAVLAAVPVLPYRQLPPPDAALPGELLREMQEALRANLTAGGYQLTDVRALEGAALGRAALTGETLDDAAEQTILDYLACARTTGDLATGDTSPGDADDDGEDDTAAPPPRDSYWARITVLGVKTTLAATLKRFTLALADIADQPGVPAALRDEAEGVFDQAKQVYADLRSLKGTGELAEVGPAASKITEHLDLLAAQIRPHIAALSSDQATKYAGYLMDGAGQSPVPVITSATVWRAPKPFPAPARPALTAGDRPGGGMRLQMFAKAEQDLGQYHRPEAASTSVAERVHAEQLRRQAEGLPPLTPAETAAYYARQPAPVIPLMLRQRQAGPRRPSLRRRDRHAG